MYKRQEKDSEILYAKHLSPTIEDWISPERSKLRKNGIPNLFDAYMHYLNQEKLKDVITLLNSDLSVIAELLMIKEVVPDIIMMDEGFSTIDPTIFTSPLTSLPLIIQDFSFSHVKTKGNNNLLLNNPYYENILLQKNFVIASKNFERIIEVTGKTVVVRSEKTKTEAKDINPAKQTEKREVKAEIKNPIKPELKREEKPEKPTQKVKIEKPVQEEIDHAQKNEPLQNDVKERNEKRKKILEEKARVKAERRRRRTAINNRREEEAKREETAIEHHLEPVQQEEQPTEQVMAMHAEPHQPESQQQPAPVQQQIQPQSPQQPAPVQQHIQPPPPQQPRQQAAIPEPQPKVTRTVRQRSRHQPDAPVQRQAPPVTPPQQQQQLQQQQLQQQTAQAAQEAAPMPTEGQQEEVVNSAKRALLQKRLRARLGK